MSINFRHCIAFVLTLALIGFAASALTPNTQSASKPVRIVVLGDSLSAEYGLERGSGWVALLEQKLATEKIAAEVINASISGETTNGGRVRLEALLTQYQPQLVVLELGGNDALQGLPLALIRENLSTMTQAAQQAGAKVLLIGMQVPPNFGRNYSESFASIYAQVAKTHKAGLVPFMLKGIADVPDSLKWFQADRIHPLATAQPIILDNIWPEIKKALP